MEIYRATLGVRGPHRSCLGSPIRRSNARARDGVLRSRPKSAAWIFCSQLERQTLRSSPRQLLLRHETLAHFPQTPSPCVFVPKPAQSLGISVLAVHGSGKAQIPRGEVTLHDSSECVAGCQFTPAHSNSLQPDHLVRYGGRLRKAFQEPLHYRVALRGRHVAEHAFRDQQRRY